MNSKGQIQFEAMAVFALFLATISIFLLAFSEQGIQLDDFSKKFSYETEAFSCAIAANSIYSNSTGNLTYYDSNCGIDSKNSFSSNGKSAQSVAKELKKSNFGEKIFVTVLQNEHYK